MDQRGEMVWASLDFPHPAVCEEFHFGGPKLGPIPNFRWEAQLSPQCYTGPNLPRADRTRPGIDKSEESASPASRKAFSESPLRDTAKSHHGSGPPSPSCALLPPLLLLLSECLASNKRRRAHPHRGILHGQGNLSIRLDLDLFISFLFPFRSVKGKLSSSSLGCRDFIDSSPNRHPLYVLCRKNDFYPSYDASI